MKKRRGWKKINIKGFKGFHNLDRFGRNSSNWIELWWKTFLKNNNRRVESLTSQFKLNWARDRSLRFHSGTKTIGRIFDATIVSSCRVEFHFTNLARDKSTVRDPKALVISFSDRRQQFRWILFFRILITSIFSQQFFSWLEEDYLKFLQLILAAIERINK